MINMSTKKVIVSHQSCSKQLLFTNNKTEDGQGGDYGGGDDGGDFGGGDDGGDF